MEVCGRWCHVSRKTSRTSFVKFSSPLCSSYQELSFSNVELTELAAGPKGEFWQGTILLPIENLSIGLLLHHLIVGTRLALLKCRMSCIFLAFLKLSSGSLLDKKSCCLPSLLQEWVRNKDPTSVQRPVLSGVILSNGIVFSLVGTLLDPRISCLRRESLSPEVQESEPLACSHG